MASLVKLTVIRWIDPVTKKRVPAETLGAKKVRERTGNYYIVDKTGGRVVRTNTGCSDLRAAQAVLTEYHRAQERGAVGLTDPFKPHLDRPVTEHLVEYVAVLRERVRTDAYPQVVERELRRMFLAVGIITLKELSPDKVQQYMAGWPVKAVTKNRARSYLFSFCGWLVKRGRLPTNVAERVDTAKAKPGEASKRHRRAMSPKELRQLLAAAENYPLAVASTNQGGRPRRDGQRPSPSAAALSDATRAELQQQGRERRLLYRTALLTGLRRGELSRVRVSHLRLKEQVIELPGELTKNGRPAAIPLVPALAADLRRWVKSAGRLPGDHLFAVPEARNMVRQHKARLKYAAVSYQTTHGFADFHSLRKATNTYLRRRGVTLRLRQRFLRHAAADLATSVYDDERLGELGPVTKELAQLDGFLSGDRAD